MQKHLLILTLRQTLSNYSNYVPSTIKWWMGLRDKWIPVVIHKRFEKRVCAAADQVLQGKCPEFRGMTEEKRLAVTMLVMQIWANEVRADRVNNAQEAFIAHWMNLIPVDHAMTALRNAAGGKETMGVCGKACHRIGSGPNSNIWMPLFRNKLDPEVRKLGHY